MASICFFSLPSLASSSTFSLPSMLVCARTLYSVVAKVEFFVEVIQLFLVIWFYLDGCYEVWSVLFVF